MKKQTVPPFIGFLLLLILGWYVNQMAHQEVTTAIRIIIYAVTVAVILVLLVIILFIGLLIRERVLKERARRQVMERKAKVMYLIAGEGQQVYIRDTDSRANWRNAHLDVRVYANGQPGHPSPAEMAAWQTYTLRHRAGVVKDIAPPPLLPASTTVDLLTALDNVQRCLIVGASDSGKTTLLQWLVHRRLHTSKVIVIDPHAYPDKWPGCVVVGTGRNYPEIDRALEALVRLMTKRYDEIGKGIVVEQGHSRITILIDEWRAIVYNVKGAGEAIKALLTESRKAAFSVFVATHSDRAKPLGLEGEYDLKDGFAIVRLSVANGQRQATLDVGNGEVPVILPGVSPTLPAQLTESDEFINLDVEPTPAEATILTMHEEGQSISAIADTVFGSKGGNQNQQVKKILNKYRV